MVFNEKKENEFLESYDASQYKHPSVTVDLTILTTDEDGKLEILLNKRNDFPFKDCWALPGTFVKMDETFENTVSRILKEKIGSVTNYKSEQLYTFDKVDRDPRTRVISIAYLVLISKNSFKYKNDENNKWFTVKLNDDNKLQFGEEIDLAFDHEDIIKTLIKRLRGKISYTTLSFELLSDKTNFTIYELQKIHEAISNKKFDVANFRRDFKNYFLSQGIVESNGQKSSAFSKKPSACYKVNETLSDNYIYRN